MLFGMKHISIVILCGILPFSASAQEKLADCSIRTNPLIVMACNIFEEARAESFQGKVAVGYGTINRVRHPAYPKTIPAVVWQGGQYDWTVKPRVIYAREGVRKQWEDSVRAAMIVMIAQHRADYEKHDITHGAVNFHARGDKVIWPNMVQTTKIGTHRFFVDKRGIRVSSPLSPPISPVTKYDFVDGISTCTETSLSSEKWPTPTEL